MTSTKNVDGTAGAKPQTVPFAGPRESQDAFVENDHASVSVSGSVPLKSRPYEPPVWTASDAIGFTILGARFTTETWRTDVVASIASPTVARAEKKKSNVPRLPITRTR